MKTLLIAGALALATMTAGCAQFDAAVTSLNQPGTQAALSTIRTTAAQVACVVAATSGNKKSVVYAVSRDACLIAGGALQ